MGEVRDFKARERVRFGTVALVLALVGTACGTQLSHERLLEDARGGPAAAAAPVSTAETAPSAQPTTEAATPEMTSEAGAGGVTPAAGLRSAPGPSGGVAKTQVGRSETPRAGVDGAAPAASGGGGTAAAGSGGTGSAGGGAAGLPGAASPERSCSTPKTPVIIGSVGTLTGPAGTAVGGTARVVGAWTGYINTKGGVNCHPVKYIVKDDGGDPSRNQALTKELVEQDHVVALVGVVGVISGEASVKYVTEKRIPVVGTELGSGWVYESPMFFPQASSHLLVLESAFAAVAEEARQRGFTKLATMSCIEARICADLDTVAPTLAQKYGMSLVYRGRGAITQPDYTSNCQAAKQAGAEFFLMGWDANSTARTARSCDTVGFHPIFASLAAGANLSMADNPLLDGFIVGMTVMPWMVTSNPGIVEYRNALAKYAPGMKPDVATIIGWVAAKLFELAAQNISEPPTSQSVLDGLWSIKDNDLGGLTQPLTFVREQNAQKKLCWWSAQLRSGQFVTPDNGKRTCE